PGGSRRRTVDEALGALRCDFDIEGIVELARYGPGLVAQTLVIDSYDLIKLGVLTVAGHRALRLFRHTILLWPRDRHHVYRRLRAAISCPCSEQSLPSRIDMIVALQHEVDSLRNARTRAPNARAGANCRGRGSPRRPGDERRPRSNGEDCAREAAPATLPASQRCRFSE